MLIGAHVSIAGGIFNAPLNAAKIGAEVFQIFTRSPHGGSVKPLTPDVVNLFKKNCELTGIPFWVVHTPYFINFGSAQTNIRFGSISVLKEELERASLLGAKYLMTHLGSYKDLGKAKGYEQLINSLDKVLIDYKGTTEFLIEISAGAGDVIGKNFGEVAEIIYNSKLKKYNIGVCFDTQHAFGSGYDLRTPEKVKETFDKFDSSIGLDKLKMFHCNDSKVGFNAKMDRHEHIGKGHIGKQGFEAIFSFDKIRHLNFILETEHDLIAQDLEITKEIREKTMM